MLTYIHPANMDQHLYPTNYAFTWTTELLREVGIPLNVHGYRYLLEAVQLSLSVPELCSNLSNRLYPSVAERFHTSASRVERSIRTAIEIAWKRGHLKEANPLFGRSINLIYDKPTNSEMIAFLTDKIRARIYENKMMTD